MTPNHVIRSLCHSALRAAAYLALALTGTTAAAQTNVQLHYDFGRALYSDMKDSKRPLLTSTVEHFNTDRLGSNFFFIDMDYDDAEVKSAYWELSREFNLGKESPLALHLEYDGGTGGVKDCWLAGLAYNGHNADYSFVWGFQAMYKYLNKQRQPNSFQLTATWTAQLADGLVTLSGFADFWRQKDFPHGDFCFMSEPQVWLNLNGIRGVSKDFNLSIGSEVEICNNFAFREKTFYAIPTIAAKWVFK